MPGPLVKDSLSGYRKWANEENSVFDPLYEQLLRRAVKETGLDAPETTLMGGDLANPLVSIYKDKAARMAGLDALRKTAVRRLGPDDAGAFEKFARMFPRLAAHTEIDNTVDIGSANGRTMGPPTVPDRPIKVALKPGTSTDQIAETMIHEGTHVAQHLGNRNFKELYMLASRLFGYHRNPFEESAYRRQAKPTEWAGTATKQLRKMALDQRAILDDPEYVPRKFDARDLQNRDIDRILQILDEREKRGWTPNPNYKMMTGKEKADTGKIRELMESLKKVGNIPEIR